MDLRYRLHPMTRYILISDLFNQDPASFREKAQRAAQWAMNFLVSYSLEAQPLTAQIASILQALDSALAYSGDTTLALQLALALHQPMIHAGLSRFAGRSLAVDEETYASASHTNHRNRALAQLLQSLGALTRDHDETVDLYTRQSCLAVTARDLAIMGATLADGGVTMKDMGILAAGCLMGQGGIGQQIQKQVGQTGIPVYNVSNACATGATALYVTHDHAEAFALADRVGVMRAGRLVQVGTAQELGEAPVDEWVASFLR